MTMITRILVMMAVLLAPLSFALAQVRVVGAVGSYYGHTVYLLEAFNQRSGDFDYAIGALPNVGHAPYPVIVFFNPYSVVSSPPSENPADSLWTWLVSFGTPFHYDVSLPVSAKFRVCMTPTGDCPVTVGGAAPLWDLGLFGEFSGRSREQSNVNWALRNGYAVLVVFGRHYAGRDAQSVILGAQNMINGLKNMPGLIDSGRIGVTGASQGGFLSVYSVLGNDIAASVAVVPWIDSRAMHRYYFDFLPTIQPPNIYAGSWNFVAQFDNRWKMAFGDDPSSSRWDHATYGAVASRMNTPIMLIGSSDDAMCPVVEVERFSRDLSANGKPNYLWTYSNGRPPLETNSTGQIGHGRVDTGHFAQVHILSRYMFIHHMPPDEVVVMEHPNEVDLVGIIREFAGRYFDPSSTQADRDNLLRLAYGLMGNSNIWYQSYDYRIPSGSAPYVIQNVINLVLSGG